MFRPVNRKAYEEMVILKKFAPVICQKCAVGLQGIFDVFTGSVFFLQLKDFGKEIHSPHDGLTAMPCKKYVPVGLTKDITGDKEFEHLIAHVVLIRIIGIELFLFEVIAIRTIKIADCTNGLRHDVVADL